MPQNARRLAPLAFVLDYRAGRCLGEGPPAREVPIGPGFHSSATQLSTMWPVSGCGELRESPGVEEALRPVLPGHREHDAGGAEEERRVQAHRLVHDELDRAHPESLGSESSGARDEAAGSVACSLAAGGLRLRFDTPG